MTEETKKRVETLSELFDKIPPEKQEAITIGIAMLAAAFEQEQKKTA